MKHKPSGLSVRTESERSQKQNYENALSLLRARLWTAKAQESQFSRDQNRRIQIGSGQRGDKIRTYRYQDDIVIDHRTNKKVSLSSILRGDLSELS